MWPENTPHPFYIQMKTEQTMWSHEELINIVIPSVPMAALKINILQVDIICSGGMGLKIRLIGTLGVPDIV